MQSAESATLSDAYNESDVAPHDGRAGHDPFDERIRIAQEDSRSDERLRWSRSDASQRGAAFGNKGALIKKPSLGKRMVRTTARFVVAVLIGVGATLAWQAYGDQARAMLATWDPSLAWLNPPAATQPPTAAAAVSAADLAQQLKPITVEIAALHHDLEQLAAKQDQLVTNQGQLAQGLSTLQAAEREVGLKISSMTATKPVHAQPHHPAQIQPHEPTPLQPREAARRPVQPPDDPDGR